MKKKYPAYKSSGVEWLGDVPKHWEVKKIKWETPVARGASPRPIDDPVYFDDEGEYAWVRIADVTNSGGFLTNTTQRLSEIGSSLSVKMQPNSLFLSIAGTVGLPCITKVKCCIHDGFVYFTKLKANTQFMYYIFDCGEPYKGLGKMGTQLNLNTDTVGSIVMGFPPIAEQKTIANFLDKETAKINALIEKNKLLIKLLKEKRSALIAKAVTKGLDSSVTYKPSGVEWLGDVPKHWEVKRTGFAYEIQLGKMLQPKQNSDIDIQYRYLKAFHVNWEKIATEELPQMWASENDFKKYLVKQGDLLVCEGGEVGRSGIITTKPESILIQNSLHRVRSNLNDVKFLMYILRVASSAHWLDILCNKATIAHFTREKFSHLSIPLPPIAEQKTIANFLDKETAKIDALIEKNKLLVEKLNEYRLALISSVVTGKIDVRECYGG